MPIKRTDSELIAACIEGLGWAWDALVERYKRLVYSIALRAGLGEEDAADVFQTTFIQLLEHLHTLRTPQGLAAWLITTSKRESWRLLRRQQREPPLSDEEDSRLEMDDGWLNHTHPDEDLWTDQVLVREGLQLLGGRCQDLLLLLYYDHTEPSYDEIGRRLGMPMGSIGPNRARCLQKLRQILQGMGMMPA